MYHKSEGKRFIQFVEFAVAVDVHVHKKKTGGKNVAKTQKKKKLEKNIMTRLARGENCPKHSSQNTIYTDT